jgi:hypothetical protein
MLAPAGVAARVATPPPAGGQPPAGRRRHSLSPLVSSAQQGPRSVARQALRWRARFRGGWHVPQAGRSLGEPAHPRPSALYTGPGAAARGARSWSA